MPDAKPKASAEFDAEGMKLGEACPQCGSSETVTYLYNEGFSELECRRCTYTSEALDIADLRVSAATSKNAILKNREIILLYPSKSSTPEQYV